MSEQRNLFLAVVLSMAVVFGWQYLVGVPKMQEEQARQQQIAEQQNQAPQNVPAPAAPKALPRTEALAESSQRADVDTATLAGKGQEGLTRMRETMAQLSAATTLVQSKLDEHGLLRAAELREAEPEAPPITLGPFTLEFVRMAHSVPDAVGIAKSPWV